MARIVKLIQTEVTEGNGTSTDPYRTVTQYWTKEGELLWSTDEKGKTIKS